MGAYVNPKVDSKEKWLLENAIILNTPPPEYLGDEKHLLVCLVDNGPFTAAGICFNEGEYKAFVNDDGKKKFWFKCEVEKLHTVSPELKNYINENHTRGTVHG